MLACPRKWTVLYALSKFEFFYLVKRVLCKNTCCRLQAMFRGLVNLDCSLHSWEAIKPPLSQLAVLVHPSSCAVPPHILLTLGPP